MASIHAKSNEFSLGFSVIKARPPSIRPVHLRRPGRAKERGASETSRRGRNLHIVTEREACREIRRQGIRQARCVKQAPALLVGVRRQSCSAAACHAPEESGQVILTIKGP